MTIIIKIQDIKIQDHYLLNVFQMNTMNKLILLCIITLSSINTASMAHSVNFETEMNAPTVLVKAFFSRTSPIVNASVIIYAPGETEPYQTGRTDKAGYFSFIPNVSGDWIFTLDDERGHVGRVGLTIMHDFFNADVEVVNGYEAYSELAESEETVSDVNSEKGVPVIYRIIFGLALIFGITGTIYGFKAKHLLAKNRE